MSLWVRSDSGLWVYAKNLDIERFYYATYFGMSAGSLIFILTLAGCFGTLLDSKLLLFVYTILSLITFILEIALVIAALKPPLGDSLQSKLAFEIKQHIDQMEYSANSRSFLDLIQLKLQCCAAYTFLDYKQLNYPVPQSCSSDLTNNINYRSCGEMLRRYLEIRAGIMGGLSMALAFLQATSTSVSIGYYKFSKRFANNI